MTYWKTVDDLRAKWGDGCLIFATPQQDDTAADVTLDVYVDRGVSRPLYEQVETVTVSLA